MERFLRLVAASVAAAARAEPGRSEPRSVVRHPWETMPAASPFRNGAYEGPFTSLTTTYLDVVNLTDGYGPEDKLQACNGQLVFVDLDSDGEWYAYNGTWSRGFVELDTLCPSGSQLYPRGNGYTVGTARIPSTGGDRLLVLGGTDKASMHNVYYSDDCGRRWSCSSAPQLWGFQDYASIVRAPSSFPEDVTVMGAGGTLSGDLTGTLLFSSDGGITWERPQCAASGGSAACQVDCMAQSRTICYLGRLGEPDVVGSCTASNPDWPLCYIVPDWPIYPGECCSRRVTVRSRQV